MIAGITSKSPLFGAGFCVFLRTFVMPFGPPILWVPIFAVTGEDRRRLPDALAEIGRDDQNVLVRRDPQTEELLYSGTSVEHLTQTFRCVFDKMDIASWIGKPRVRYLETIATSAAAEGKYIRQTGGRGNYGHVKLRLEPNQRGKGTQFASEIPSGVVPDPYIAPVEEGIREAARGGILAGEEMTDLRVMLYDGSFHEVDSNPTAFRIAASLAFKEAARKARPIVLEPVMNVSFTVPEARHGAIVSKISARRGRVVCMRQVRGLTVLNALIPLAEMLRETEPAPTMMEFEGFEPAPPRSDNADPAGSTVRNPWGPKPLADSATAGPDLDEA